MRKSVEDKKCDPCQKRKEEREFVAPLEAEEPTFLFEITSMDITDLYLITPRKNKYLLTFIDHFTTYMEAYPIRRNMCQSICHSGYHLAWYRIHTDKTIFHRNMQHIGDPKSKHVELSPLL